MRLLALLAIATLALAQAGPADASLARAYEALRSSQYDIAITNFIQAIDLVPDRPTARKDLAYTYLKVGENELARLQFQEAMQLDPADTHAALEYAFLCFESKDKSEARRIFDRLRRTGDQTAKDAFQNIDAPLAAGINRWKAALELAGPSYSAHFELATLAEQREELELAAEHFEKAWRLRPDRRYVLVELGRVWKTLGRIDDAAAALLASSRGGEPYAAELAREQLPDRYPFVAEFRRALELDSANVELRRELAYLLLRMNQQSDAEAEFASLAPNDLLAATQLGFLLYARGERAAAQPHLDRVLAGNDEDLANRVRAVLHMPQVSPVRDSHPQSIDAKVMAERSGKAGYMKDALKYLEIAHEADPADFDVILKLGWTNNLLHQDRKAYQWFNLARRSSDPRVAGEATQAWRNLRPLNEQFRLSVWLFPVYSSRWSAAFSYGQAKIEFGTALPLRPYLSARLIGDSSFLSARRLSEESVIFGLGLTTPTIHGLRAWFEAGNAIGYTRRHMLPDYRGGVSFTRSHRGVFETSVDALYVSRFDKDFLVYNQSRVGRLAGPFQAYWNINATVDSKRESWANFGETGPGMRMSLLPSSFFTLNLLRGAYFLNRNNPRPPNFTDIRAGLWYAFTR